MSNLKQNVTSPVGRLVGGSLYEPSTTDAEGKPLLFKTGANAGQPRVNFYFALAVPKTQAQWWDEVWGKVVASVGMQAFPQSYNTPGFAWKIDDGDSTIPNKKGKKPCDNEGWRGNWILKFSGGTAPKIWKHDDAGNWIVPPADFIKPGYFIEVDFSVDGNGSPNQPGVYLNHRQVAFRAFGEEISLGRSVEEAGFGKSPLPAGASLTPPAGMSMPSSPTPAAGPSMTPALAAPVGPGANVMTVSPTNITPNPAFLQGPGSGTGAGPANGPGASVPVLSTPTNLSSPPNGPRFALTAKAIAEGGTYDAYIKLGWTDAQLIQAGLIVPA